jgi:hypothetical protein
MKPLAALAVGYFLGARSGGKDLDQLARSLEALCGTDEFADVVTAARSQLGSGLRELAAFVEGNQRESDRGGDIVTKVRNLVGRD